MPRSVLFHAHLDIMQEIVKGFVQANVSVA